MLFCAINHLVLKVMLSFGQGRIYGMKIKTWADVRIGTFLEESTHEVEIESRDFINASKIGISLLSRHSLLVFVKRKKATCNPQNRANQIRGGI